MIVVVGRDVKLMGTIQAQYSFRANTADSHIKPNLRRMGVANVHICIYI